LSRRRTVRVRAGREHADALRGDRGRCGDGEGRAPYAGERDREHEEEHSGREEAEQQAGEDLGGAGRAVGVSRMVRVLAEEGLLETMPDPLGGNRKRLALTDAGEAVVRRWGGDLEERLARLLEAAGVPYRTYLTHTNRLLAALEALPAPERQPAAGSGRSPDGSHP
jgi:hypothetical protein